MTSLTISTLLVDMQDSEFLLVVICRDTYALVPLALGGFAIGINSYPNPMLLALPPLPSVHPTVWPKERTLTMLHVILIRSFISTSIRPIHLAQAVHVPLLPLANMSAAIDELIATLAVHLVVQKLPLIHDAGPRAVDADAILGAMHELSLIACTIRPDLYSASRLFVLIPFALVRTAIDLGVLPVTMHPVLIPLAIIHVPVGSNEHAMPVSPTIFKRTLIPLPVQLRQHAMAMPLISPPLPSVSRTTLHLLLFTLLQLQLFDVSREVRSGHILALRHRHWLLVQKSLA
mmetsp:Transcript_154699/g.281223  ORF Transcript_154699/g.281223 Transcript_154699/m.281223 type:complete len:289 (+) Transcript_154699:175-1041(+)